LISDFPPTATSFGLGIEAEIEAVTPVGMDMLPLPVAEVPGLKYELKDPAAVLSPSVLAAGVKGGSLRSLRFLA
jgi:hypothetical protein